MPTSNDKRLQAALNLLWSNKSTTAIFHPVTSPMLTVGIKNARPTVLELREPTPNFSISVAYQLTNDPTDETSWGSTTELSAAYVTSAGFTYTSAFTDISANLTKRYIRFGINVKNTTGTALELGQGGMVVDIRED